MQFRTSTGPAGKDMFSMNPTHHSACQDRRRPASISGFPLRLNKLLCALLLSAGTLTLWGEPVHAQKNGPATEAPARSTIVKTFSELGAGSAPIRLTTHKSGYLVKLPVSAREVSTGAKLILETANSTALIKSRSELAVRVNGRMLGQFALDPVKTLNVREIPIPIELLKTGYNEVFISVVQHYANECEDPSSPELWTEISALNSSISMSFSGLKPNLEPSLAQLSTAFDRKAWISRPLAVVSGTELVQEAQMTAAAMAVQGLSLRMGYRPLDVEVYGASTGAASRAEPTLFPGLSSSVVKGNDVLLIGKIAELSRYVSPEIRKQMSAGPFVGIYPLMQGESMVLIVSGNTDAELMTAARTLADPGFRFSDVQAETIRDEVSFTRPTLATPKKTFAFSEFDFKTSESRGFNLQPISLEFRAPASYGAQKGDLASIRLHFSYGAGLSRDSSMIVKLNGHFAVAVPLSEAAGAEFQKYEIKVPAQVIKPGFNTLSFEPVFMAQRNRCDLSRDEGMVLTLYEDSSIELPVATVLPKAPDLERFASGFWPLNDKLPLYLTQRDTRTAAAALNFVGALAQKNRAPFEVDVSFAPADTGDLFVFGPQTGLAAQIGKALPLRRSAWTAAGDQAGVLQAVEGKRVITAFLANDAGALTRASRSLIGAGLWNGMQGQASIIDLANQSIRNEPATETTTFGSFDRITEWLGSWKLMAALTLSLAALFVGAFVRVLRRSAAKRTGINIEKKA